MKSYGSTFASNLKIAYQFVTLICKCLKFIMLLRICFTEQEIKSEPGTEDETKLMPPPSLTPIVSKPAPLKDVKKPLASMLPEKYKNVDIAELFPEFRENQVLRFSRLFPIKSSYKPRIWKNVKRRFKTENEEDESDSPAEKKSKGKILIFSS
jgi:hypothetical protein